MWTKKIVVTMVSAIGLFSTGALHAQSHLPKRPDLKDPEILGQCLKNKSLLKACADQGQITADEFATFSLVMDREASGVEPVSITLSQETECEANYKALKDCLVDNKMTLREYKLLYRGAFKVAMAYYYSQINLDSGFTDKIPKRCEGDLEVNPEQARGRNLWVLQCLKDISPELTEGMRNIIQNNKGGNMQYATLEYVDLDGNGNAVFTRPTPYVAPHFVVPADDEAKAMEMVKAIPCDIPEGWTIAAVCTSGCYMPDETLEFAEGISRIGDSAHKDVKSVVTVQKDADLDHLSFGVKAIRNFIESERDVTHEILEIRTQSGKTLKVTTNHPLVNIAGDIQPADTLKVGDQLVNKDGGAERIEDIKPISFFGKVYNLFVDSKDLKENVVVAQGLLNGSAYYQNQTVKYFNAVLARTQIPESMVKVIQAK